MGGGAYPSPQKIFEFFSLEMNTFIWTKQHKKEEKEQDKKNSDIQPIYINVINQIDSRPWHSALHFWCKVYEYISRIQTPHTERICLLF